MQYLLDLFTPATWQAFRRSGAEITGFRPRQRRLAQERVRQGDIFLCYLTRLSRWCGALRVGSEMYEDEHPVFSDPDPFSIRFKVEPIVLLEPDYSIPIHNDNVWKALSMTCQYDKGSSHWTGFFRSSLNRFNDIDGRFLFDLLNDQDDKMIPQPLTERDRRHLQVSQVRTLDRIVEVEIPEDDATELTDSDTLPTVNRKESLKIQAIVAEIGARLGFRIWAPPNDRRQVLQHVSEDLQDSFLELLPLNYDDTTLRTIEQIDILWLKGRSIVRAFEIEHTTAIYSGLLRMADLLALQPIMDIRLHIVAPEDRRGQVLREIRRPVFTLLERGPLHEQCTYVSYDSINELRKMPNLRHTKDTIIGEFEETAEV